MAFDEITQVIPFMECALLLGVNLNAPQVAEPRVFKSHVKHDEIPKGARYVVAVRDPKDALVSNYHFLEGWLFEPGSVSLTEFIHGLIRWDFRGYWRFLGSWWPHRHDAEVLMLCFEDLKQDLPQAVRLIARFIGCEADDSLLQLVVRQASFEFMFAHKTQFDEHLLREALDPVYGLPPGGNSDKVRTGQVGGHIQELSREMSAELDNIWAEEIAARYQIASYQALREALAYDE